ncbi:hypothetical protein MKW11_08530 [Gluconobacter frateurii]|uniref:hypothetical protein n=1 Tax=Gluconobacter frateurii TaxID=38308 RepID=UPI001F05EFBD|nr:hypothetical protein [Gluconobacter frateurii]UMM07280.1 hypothetical protein MKW11_08530 [Gluconobacter frateurii]
MRRITRAVLLAAPLLIGTAVVAPNAVVPAAEAHWHGGYGGPGRGYYGPGPGWNRSGHHGNTGAVVGGILGGLAIGAVGGAMLSHPYGPPPPPVVYAPPPRVVYAPPPVVYAPPPPPVVVYPQY